MFNMRTPNVVHNRNDGNYMAKFQKLFSQSASLSIPHNKGTCLVEATEDSADTTRTLGSVNGSITSHTLTGLRKEVCRERYDLDFGTSQAGKKFVDWVHEESIFAPEQVNARKHLRRDEYCWGHEHAPWHYKTVLDKASDIL